VIHRLSTTILGYWMWWAVAFGGVLAFLFWPGGYADKTRLLLHGLCAQTPSHTFTFGGLMLPFDARMTGIYAGAIFTLITMVARRRFFSAGLPPLRVMVVLGGFVAIMAADGFNSLFTDIGLWHPWESRNELRLLTGYGTGVTLAVVLVWLVSSTLWRLSGSAPVVRSVREVGIFWVPFVPYAAAVLSGTAWLYVPLSMLLVIAAWCVLTLLTLSMVLLAMRWDDRVIRRSQLHVPGAIAGIAGLAVMLVLAFGRVWLERATGIPSTL
jgi:uncharacterized membrane protein